MTEPDEPAPSAGGRRRRYWPALDGLRALAVLAVMAYHLGPSASVGGRLGVDAFFVLSGFLITTVLLDEQERTGATSLRQFYLRRARRLLPGLAVTVVATVGFYAAFVVGPVRGPTIHPGALAGATYTTTWLAVGHVDTGALRHLWSLSVEEHFYLVWPFVLAALLASRRPVSWMIATYLVAVAWRTYGWLGGWDQTGLYFRPDMRAHEILVGCLLAFVVWRLRPPLWSLAAALGAPVVVAVMAGYPRLSTWSPDAGPFPVLFALAVAAIVGYLVAAPDGWLAAALSVPILVWIGRRSYGLYLVHVPVFHVLLSREDRLRDGVPFVAVSVAVSFALAALSYRYVEQPVLRRRRGLTPAPAAG